jgi:hypothetical protein
MEGMAGAILLRPHERYRLLSIDEVSQVRVRKLGVHKSCFGHGEGSAAQLNCHLPRGRVTTSFVSCLGLILSKR